MLNIHQVAVNIFHDFLHHEKLVIDFYHQKACTQNKKSLFFHCPCFTVFLLSNFFFFAPCKLFLLPKHLKSLGKQVIYSFIFFYLPFWNSCRPRIVVDLHRTVHQLAGTNFSDLEREILIGQ